ncbi:MAG: outer membrane beta-barrel protein [Acidiferrobacterales bacterium]
MNLSIGAGVLRVIVVAAATSTAAQAAGWYVGAGTGGGHAVDATGNVFQSVSVLSNGGVAVAGDYDSSQSVFQLFGGYRFNPYFAAEAGYIDFGRYTLNSVAQVRAGYAAASETDSIHALYVAAVGSYPISRWVSVFGKLGLASSRDRETCFVSGVFCPSASDSATEPVVGLGVEFPVTPVRWRARWAMRVEYDRYSDIGNSANEYTAGNFSTITANGLYRF